MTEPDPWAEVDRWIAAAELRRAFENAKRARIDAVRRSVNAFRIASRRSRQLAIPAVVEHEPRQLPLVTRAS